MSLIRLLTTGKCFTDLREPVGRYRMTDPRALPKFGSAKAPGAIPAVPELPGCETAPPETGKDSASVAAASQPAAGLPQPRSDVLSAQALGASRRGAAKIMAWAGRMRTGLKERFSRRRRPAPSPSLARPARSPVQGELSLDLVKVMRNDLSDTDLEIVAVKAPAAQTSSASPRAVGRIQAAERAVSRATTRLFATAKL
jgi:hypothetical protein